MKPINPFKPIFDHQTYYTYLIVKKKKKFKPFLASENLFFSAAEKIAILRLGMGM